jgi:hypothetical protein
MLGQVRQELALGMGMGNQHYEKTQRQSKKCRSQAVVLFVGSVPSEPLLKKGHSGLSMNLRSKLSVEKLQC